MTLINKARNVGKNGPIQERTIKDFIDAFEYCEHLCSFPGEGFRVRHKGIKPEPFLKKYTNCWMKGLHQLEKDGETDSQALERTIVENHFQEYKVEQCTVFRTLSGELKFQGSQIAHSSIRSINISSKG